MIFQTTHHFIVILDCSESVRDGQNSRPLFPLQLLQRTLNHIVEQWICERVRADHEAAGRKPS